MLGQSVGAKVQAIRNERGMTSTELARKVGISQAQISRLESGRQGWRSITLQKAAKALGVSVGFLYADEKSDAAAAAMLRHQPKLKKVLSSATLSDLALRLAEIQRMNPKAFRAFRVLIEQHTN